MARKMKNSGVMWVGKIPSNWNITRVKYICESYGRIGFRGYTENDLVDEGEGAITISPSNMKNMKMDYSKCSYLSWNKYEESPEIKLSNNDVLFVKTGSTYGKTAIVENLPMEATINPQLLIFKNIKIYTKYFFYNFQTPYIKSQIENAVVGGTIPTIAQGKINNFFFIIPPVPEQRNIADFLDGKCAEIDGLLADLDAEVKTLAEYKKSIIAETVTRGLNPNAPMKQSGIPWAETIPAHWTTIRGKYAFRLLQRPVKEDDGVVTCFRDGQVTLRSNRREDGFTMSDKEYGYQGIEPGDLVVHGMDGFAGAIGISDSRGKGTPVLNVLDSNNNKRYLMYYLRNMAYGNVFIALSTGIRVRSCDLSWKKLGEVRIVLPPIEEQNAIADYIDHKLEEAQNAIATKLTQIETLKSYKASLIYEYVTGKKQVI